MVFSPISVKDASGKTSRLPLENRRWQASIPVRRQDGNTSVYRLKRTTVARYLRHLKVTFRWANRQGYLTKLPSIEIPKQSKGIRGRPITMEEFERMLDVTTKVAGKGTAGSWRFYLRGLCGSGLRLEESWTLRWDEALGAIVIELNGKKVHYSTVYRWATKGVRGRILEAIRVGEGRYTSVEALERFLSASTPAASEAPQSAPLNDKLAAIQCQFD